MKRLLSILAVLFIASATVRADVHDGAHIFSQSAIDKADNEMSQMQRKHNKDLVVETFAKVPDDQQAKLQQENKEAFFGEWAITRANALKVNGVYALISMDPKFIKVVAGEHTRTRGDFTEADITRLRQQMQNALHQQQYDQGLLQAVGYVDRAYTANINSGGASNGQGGAYPSVPNYPSRGGGGQSVNFGSLICLGIGALLLFSLVRRVLGGRSSYGQGYGNYGGNPGYGYGGGGGFGSGLLGGLLGGVIGGEADRWMHGGSSQSGQNFPTNSGGGFGGSFDSGPSDAGQGFGGSDSGGDFGSSGGGGDSGGSF